MNTEEQKKRVHTTIMMDRNLRRAIRRHAVETNRTFSAVFNEAVRVYLDTLANSTNGRFPAA
jgi:predicted transcriptional regulator